MRVETEIFTLKGKAILPYVEDLANLRIQVFREYPYLYDGSMEYEHQYLKRFVEAPGSIMVLVKDTHKNQIVGASTACPLVSEMEEIKAPFIAKKMPINQIFYFSESVLLSPYRGLGIGKKFFQERERLAVLDQNIKYLTFCAVERESTHPKKPSDYQSPEKLWLNQGFEKRSELQTFFEWKEVGENEKTFKRMVFWVKIL